MSLRDPVMRTANETIKSEKRILKDGESVALAKRFRFAIAFAFVILIMYHIDMSAGIKAFNFSLSNTKEMFGLIPPIFVFMGLLDSWIPKETFMRYMGENSGFKGVFTALFLVLLQPVPFILLFQLQCS